MHIFWRKLTKSNLKNYKIGKFIVTNNMSEKGHCIEFLNMV